MKILQLLAVSLILTLQAAAQPQQTIRGSMNIKYNSRETTGAKDVYNLNINLANAVLFTGNITDTPQVISGYISKTVTQPRSLNYDIACDVINPRNPTQTKNVAQLKGRVGISSDGTYQYNAGNVSVDILAGRISSSKFTGTVVGKPLNRPVNWFENLKCEAVSITRSINGKVSKTILTKYDKMEFRNHVLAAGPYGDTVTVNGEMFYDYNKKCWYFNNFGLQYVADMVTTNNGAVTTNTITKADRITGTIRWLPSPKRLDDGKSEYQFDIKLNEPPVSASAAFEASATDVSSYFETDNSTPGLVGTMKYQDRIRKDGSEDGVTLDSTVTVDLVGNGLSPLQTMSLCKLIIFSSVVPMNSD